MTRATGAPSSVTLDRHGWLRLTAGVERRPSPNHDHRPAGMDVSLLVIHNISLPPGEFGGRYIADLFQNTIDLDAHPWFVNLAGLRVSAHFLIRRDGHIAQFVSTDHRAWHAGVSQFAGRERCNDFSIGIELEGTDTLPYTDAQYATLGVLTPVLNARYPLRAVRGHDEIAPARKTDPGPAFEWRRFADVTGTPRRYLGGR